MLTQLVGLLLFLGILFVALWGYKNVDVSSIVASITANKVSKMEKLSSSDFKNNHDYYRDIIYNYSPMLLSYIDNFELNFPRDIVGTIILLEQKGYLYIENGIFINSNIDTYSLSTLEKYILQNIHSGKLTINSKDITQIVQEEGIEKKVIAPNKKYKKSNFGQHLLTFIFIIFLIGSTISFLEEMFPQNDLFYFLGHYNFFVGIIIIIAIFILLINFLYTQKLHQNRQEDPYFRTSKGEEINEKLEGLKAYLKDYGNMKNKTAQEITLWDDYLIYSIIFKQNNIALLKYSNHIKVI